MNKRYRLHFYRNTCLTLCVFLMLTSASVCARAQAEAVTPAPTGDWVEMDGVAYRTLKVGATGDDVLRLKQRLQTLGLFLENVELTDSYNVTMEDKIKQYQNKMDMKPTGIATPELQALIYSPEGELPTPTPAPTIPYTEIDGVLYRNLSIGDEGDDVLRLKQRLQTLGVFAADAELTNAYNITMVEKIKQYQKTMNLESTGIATPELQALIYSQEGALPTPTPAPTVEYTEIDGVRYRNLKLGDEGDDVLRLKQRMQELGYFVDNAQLTGDYNITMEERVKRIQSRIGVEVNGIATPQLQSMIFSDQLPTPTPSPVSTPAADSVARTVLINGITYRTLQLNSEGEDVVRFKRQLQTLGYFAQNGEITDLYTGSTAYKVKQYQKDLGLPATGIASPELQAMSFTDFGGLTTPVPLALPTLPTLTAAGFLPADSDEEYVYQNSDQGQWIYISNSLRVEINRYHSEGSSKIVWYETSIRFTDAQSFQRYDSLQKYKNKFNTEYPNTIATRNNVVLGFSDDFYALRKERKNKQGIIIVDGKVVASEPYSRIVVYLPPLDLLALFPDGSAKAFYTNEYTADELLAMGVEDTLCFGPVLLRDGQLGQQIADGKYSSLEPRCALGMIEPRSYVLITVEGRLSTSQGVSLNWIAKRMQALGVQEALNLDGGNTTALVFCGELLNKVGTYTGESSSLTGVRSVSSIMGIGQMHTPLQVEGE